MPFISGVSGNPKGKKPGYQNFVDRANFLLAEYGMAQLEEIAADKKLLGKRSAFDAMIIMRLVEGSEKGGGPSMDRILDRLIGKAVQPVAAKLEHTHNIILDKAASQLKALPANDLKAISDIINSNVIDAEYAEVKNVDDIL